MRLVQPEWVIILTHSVVNKYERLHDVDNVYVVDAGPFVFKGDKNPTWTIMALAWRTSEHIISELKKQNI
jgi:choline dehydrogenase-like flavoprotein